LSTPSASRRRQGCSSESTPSRTAPAFTKRNRMRSPVLAMITPVLPSLKTTRSPLRGSRTMRVACARARWSTVCAQFSASGAGRPRSVSAVVTTAAGGASGALAQAPATSEKSGARTARSYQLGSIPTKMKRRAAAIFVLLVGGLLLGRLFVRSPVETTVVFQLGAPRADLRELVISYQRTSDVEEVRHVTFRYGSSAAPAEQEHQPRLSPGDYRLVATLVFADGKKETRDRTLHLEQSGRAFVDLAATTPR